MQTTYTLNSLNIELINNESYIILADCLIDEGIVNEFGIILKMSNPKADDVIADFNYMTETFRESK